MYNIVIAMIVVLRDTCIEPNASNSNYQYTYYIDVHVGRAIDYNYRYCIKVPYLSLLTSTLQQTELITAMCMLLFMTGIFVFFWLRQWMWVWSGSGICFCGFFGGNICVVLWFVL